MSKKCSVIGCVSDNTYKNVSFHRVPENFKEIWTRKNGLKWKDVKHIFICSLHFESKCFSGRKLDLNKAVPTKNTSSQNHDHNYGLKTSMPSRCCQNLIAKNESIMKEINKLRKVNSDLTQKNYYLKRKCNSLERKIEEVQEKLNVLQKEFDISMNMQEALKKCVSEVPYELMNSTAKRICGKMKEKEFHPALKKFSVTLQLCSSKAYRFVCSEFKDVLPDERTVRKWCARIDGNAGFTKQSLDFIKRKVAESERPLLLSVMCDEMSIHQHVQFDGHEFVGRTDFGDAVESLGDSKVATDALVFMAVAHNGSWKLPFGYFFIAGLNASERANLVEIAVQKLLDVGAKVVNLTCDGPRVQLSMLKKLGASLEPENIDTQICKNLDSTPVHAILDVCHCMKLMRNAWAHYRILKNSDGGFIDWSYIEKLVFLQNEETLHCATKLTSKHIHFKNNIMKVSLAVQVFSRSVAVALRFLRENLKNPEFQDSLATEEFIMILNDVFDVMNSRKPCDVWNKAPLREQNFRFWNAVLKRADICIRGLSTYDGQNVVKSASRKTGFLGMLFNIQAFKCIFEEYVANNGPLKYLLTYKCSQDHLEHFFGLIRAKFGSNNNPTPLQFKNVYRRILIRMI